MVNFFYPFDDKDKWRDLVGGNIDLFNPSYNKKTFNCDTYTYEINKNSIEYIAYYLTMFSHQRRAENWKGIVQLDFSEASENTAEENSPRKESGMALKIRLDALKNEIATVERLLARASSDDILAQKSLQYRLDTLRAELHDASASISTKASVALIFDGSP